MEARFTEDGVFNNVNGETSIDATSKRRRNPFAKMVSRRSPRTLTRVNVMDDVVAH